MSDIASGIPTLPHDVHAYGLVARLDGPTQIHLHDTFELVVNVEWKQAPHAWLLLPRSSPETKGLRQVGQQTQQKKTLQDGKLEPSQTIVYRMVATDTGLQVVAPVRYQLPLADGTELSLATNEWKVQIDTPTNWWIWGGVVAGVLVLAFMALWQRQKKKRQIAERQKEAEKLAKYRQKAETLVGRVQMAQPALWLKELMQFVEEFPPPSISLEQQSSWSRLKQAGEQARYGGGPRDAWENQEWLRLFRSLYPNLFDTQTNASEGKVNHG